MNELRETLYLSCGSEKAIGFKSVIHITNKVPERCTIEWLMTCVNDHFSPILSNWVRSIKNETTHWITLSESDYNLLIKMTWPTESKTLEKSISRQHMYLLVSNNKDILCVTSKTAIIVLSVFLKPNLPKHIWMMNIFKLMTDRPNIITVVLKSEVV